MTRNDECHTFKLRTGIVIDNVCGGIFGLLLFSIFCAAFVFEIKTGGWVWINGLIFIVFLILPLFAMTVMIWGSIFRVRLVLSKEGVVFQNFFARHQYPWEKIKGLEGRRGEIYLMVEPARKSQIFDPNIPITWFARKPKRGRPLKGDRVWDALHQFAPQFY